jgi:glycosyltransferase involved in cell wall biosynthesis
MKKNNRLKILIVTAWYRSEAAPTAASFVLEQAQMLQRAGHEVVVLHAYLSGTFLETVCGHHGHFSECDESGIWTVRLGHPVWLPGVRQWHYHWLCKKAERWVNRYQRQKGTFDLVHGHSLFMGGVVGSYLAARLGVPFFHTEHTSGLIFDPVQYTRSDIQHLHRTYKQAQQVFFVSNYAKERTAIQHHISSDNMCVLPNVIDPIFFTQVEPFPKSPYRFLCIANLIPRKNIPDLLHAWQSIEKQEPGWQLTIAGSGPLQLELQNLGKSLYLRNIRWIPRLSREEVKNEIDQHHIIVSTSKLETFGLTIAESIARGRPVAVTDSGGIRDIVTDKNGLIAEAQTPEAIAKTFLQLARQINLYDPESLQNFCLDQFGERTILHRLESSYYQLIEQH